MFGKFHEMLQLEGKMSNAISCIKLGACRKLLYKALKLLYPLCHFMGNSDYDDCYPDNTP